MSFRKIIIRFFIKLYLIVFLSFIGAVLGADMILLIPILMFLFPDETNELWMEFAYLLNPNAHEFPNITIYEGMDYNVQNLFKINNTLLLLNGKSLDEYMRNLFFSNDKNYIPKDTYNNYNKKLIYERDFTSVKIYNSPSPRDPPNGTSTENWTAVGEYFKELGEEFLVSVKEGKILLFISSNYMELFGAVIIIQSIDLIKFLEYILLIEFMKENEIEHSSSGGGGGAL